MSEPIAMPAAPPPVTASSLADAVEYQRRRLLTSKRLTDGERLALEVVLACACRRLEEHRTRRAG